MEWREDTLFLNPGAAGKARFGGPRTLALVRVGADGRPAPEIVSTEPLGRWAGAGQRRPAGGAQRARTAS